MSYRTVLLSKGKVVFGTTPGLISHPVRGKAEIRKMEGKMLKCAFCRAQFFIMLWIVSANRNLNCKIS